MLARFSAPLVLLVGLLGCQPETPAKKVAKPRANAEHLVETQPVILNTSGTKHRYTGVIQTQHTRIYNQEEGRIQSLALEPGDAVKKNQVLVHIAAQQLHAEMKKVQANEDKAKADLQRIDQMHKLKLASDVEKMQAVTALKVTVAERNILTLRIKNTTIRAPFSGILLEKMVEQGNIVPKYTHMLTLIDPKQLFIELPVSEFILPAIAVGDRPTITALNNGRNIDGVIGRILPQIDPISKQGTLIINIPQMTPPLVIGQSIQVTLTTPQLARLSIPFSALQRDHESAYVFLFEDDKAKKRVVTQGNFIGNAVEILEGLQQGEQVITKGFVGLKPDKAVVLSSSTR